jgi:hypothetical protein
VSTRSPRLAADAICIDDGRAFHGSDRFACDSSQLRKQRLDNAGIEKRGDSSGAATAAPSFDNHGSRDRELVSELLRQLHVSQRSPVLSFEPNQRPAVEGYSSHSAWIAASSLAVMAPFSFS